jgi:hypothetical protein
MTKCVQTKEKNNMNTNENTERSEETNEVSLI